MAEAVGGKSLDDLARDGIFTPLGMKSSSWALQRYSPGALATRYEVRQCVALLKICATSTQPKLNYLIGSIFNPAAEYRSFEAYPQYDGGELLSPASFDEMLKRQLPAGLDERQRFFWRDRYGLTGHAGSDRGVFTSLYFDMEKGNAVIVLMNRTPDGDTEVAMERIFERVKVDLLEK